MFTKHHTQNGYNPLMQRRWFRAKTYGWGWTPATWQGWVITRVYVATVAVAALIILRPNVGMAGWIGYGAALVPATALLIVVCYKTGEKPGWRWGAKTQR